MNRYLIRFGLCFLFVFPSWLAGALENMAHGGDLLVTAGFAGVLAWVLGLRTSEPAGPTPQRF
jgi:hypothetical protein